MHFINLNPILLDWYPSVKNIAKVSEHILGWGYGVQCP